MSRRRPLTARRVATAGVAASLLLLAGCSGGSTTASPNTAATTPAGGAGTASGTPSAPTGASGEQVSSAPLKAPDATARPGAKGKKIVVISAGQASISNSVPVAAAVEAAKALGWTTTTYDEAFNPASAPGLVGQAIASGAQGIILDATDCPTVKNALQQAKAKGIKVVGIYSFDCNDPIFGGGGQPLFSGQINYGARAADIGKFGATPGIVDGAARGRGKQLVAFEMIDQGQ